MLAQIIHILSFVTIIALAVHFIMEIYYEYKLRFSNNNILRDNFEYIIDNNEEYRDYSSIDFVCKTMYALLRIFVKRINRYYKYFKNYILFIILRIIDVVYYILSHLSKRFVRFVSKQYDDSLVINKFDPYLKNVNKESEMIEKLEANKDMVVEKIENKEQ